MLMKAKFHSRELKQVMNETSIVMQQVNRRVSLSHKQTILQQATIKLWLTQIFLIQWALCENFKIPKYSF